jgi:hypothetical protein
MEDPDDDVPVFPKGWKPKETPKVADDDVPVFPKGWKPKETPIVAVQKETPKVAVQKRQRREKRLPNPTRLDKASYMIRAGATEVSLILLDNEADMDAKLASLITDVMTLRHVVSVELQVQVSYYVNNILRKLSILTVARRRGLRSVSATECQSR